MRRLSKPPTPKASLPNRLRDFEWDSRMRSRPRSSVLTAAHGSGRFVKSGLHPGDVAKW